METYVVEITMEDIEAETPREAAAKPWSLFKVMPCDPVCTVLNESGGIIKVDLEDPDDDPHPTREE